MVRFVRSGSGGDQNARFEITTGSVGSMEAIESTGIMPINTWTHIVGVYDGSNMYIYFNGLSQNQASTSITIGTNDQPVQIGSWNQSVDNRWKVIKENHYAYLYHSLLYDLSLLFCNRKSY